MKSATTATFAIVFGCLGTSVSAQVTTVDGSADDAYGEALVIQDNSTGFGNADLGSIDFCNGSEIDSAFGFIADGMLHVLITGNVESNYNKLEIFIDAIPGEGQSLELEVLTLARRCCQHGLREHG